MFVRKQSDGKLLLIGQTDHSRFVGQLAAHWGNGDFDPPRPYESVVRGVIYHDYGWLRYETQPLVDPKNGEPFEFRQTPFSQAQLDGYQWCIDWLGSIDRYSGLVAGMHRTGLWRARYQKITHPAPRVNPQGLRPEIEEFITRNEKRQKEERSAIGEEQVWFNYHLLQVWDLLGLYFCCQDPYDDHIEPAPLRYSEPNRTVRLTMRPVGQNRVAFEPYPFNVRPLKVQIACKRLPQASFPDAETFRQAYFQAPTGLLEYDLV